MKTTVNVNGKEKEIELFDENGIAEIYSKLVRNYLNNGYNFYFYSGSQGEDVKTCLTNDGGKTVLILFVDTEYRNFQEVKSIYIKKFEDVYPNQTLWLNKGEELFKKDFYCVSERGRNKKVYVEDKEDFEMLDKISTERRTTRYRIEREEEFVELPKSCYKIALKIIHNRKGYKSIQLKDIKSVQHRIGYGYEFKFENSMKNFSIKTVNK